MIAALDPRSVANAMLDESDRIGQPVTHLALQKLLYFAHALFLIEKKRPLVSGYFEAWRNGPVHPAAYEAFKAAGRRPIAFRATRVDISSGSRSPVTPNDDPDVRLHLGRVMQSYGRLTPGRLVEISHAKGAPWNFVVDKARTSMALGLRIPDSVIVERFKFHKVSIGEAPTSGEPIEDAPFTGN
jgi:uncharacterized phage-associated protein